MTDVRTFADGAAALLAKLEARVVGPRYAREVPVDWRPAENEPPLVVVADDSGPVLWPIYTRPSLRVSVHAYGMPTARALRRDLFAVTMDGDTPGIAHIHKDRGITYTEARDIDTGADIASYTVTATVPTEVTTV